MSSFLSNKYLKYRPLLGRAPASIDYDQPCVACGYNLRGLTFGRSCPECGRPIARERSRLAADPLTEGDLGQRQWMVVGLTLAAIAPLLVILLRVGFSIGWALLHNSGLTLPAGMTPIEFYLWYSLLVSIVWAAGVWIALPRRFDGLMPRLRWLRRSARWSQLLWIVSMALWLWAEKLGAFAPNVGRVIFYAALTGIIARVGVIFAGIMFLRLSEEAELDDASHGILMAVWIVPFLSAIAMILPLEIFWFGLAIILLPLLAWAWYIVVFSRSLWSLRQHVSWFNRLAWQSGGREQRVAAARREIDRDAAAIVRPVPKIDDGSDVAVSE